MGRARDYLVFVRAGRNSLHRDWLTNAEDRNWDLQISQYDDDPEIGQGGDLPLSIDKGTKWDSIYRYLSSNPQLLDRYRYIAFMDDDLILTAQDLNRYFEICDQHDLLLAQPSLHPDSYFCYPILLQCRSIRLRYSNFVECMAAAIRTDYLRTFIPRMARVKSGWGMDRIWTVTMPDPAFKSAIIDEISMVHTRPHATGGIYQEFARNAMGPYAEMMALMGSYDGVPDKMLVYGGIGLDGRKLSAIRTRLLNGLNLTLNSWRYRDGRSTLKSGAGMFVRAVTEAHYLPKTAHRLPTGRIA